MKRRDFLQQTGLAVAGGGSVLAARGPTRAAPTEDARGESPKDVRRKRLLITSAHAQLSGVIASELAGQYRLRLAGPIEVRTEHEFIKSDLSHEEATRVLVRGVDAIVHLAEPAGDASDAERIDCQTRGAYNLLRAAAAAGVRGVVHLSSLRMMTDYDSAFDVDEDWRPLPTISSGALPDYLGEFVCREFARSGELGVIVLRLGKAAPAETAAGGPLDPLWVDPRDVAQAVSRAVALLLAGDAPPTGNWSVFHIQSESPSARFSIRTAKRLLGYRP